MIERSVNQQQLRVSDSQIGAASSFVCGPRSATGDLLRDAYQVASKVKANFPDDATWSTKLQHIASELRLQIMEQTIVIRTIVLFVFSTTYIF